MSNNQDKEAREDLLRRAKVWLGEGRENHTYNGLITYDLINDLVAALAHQQSSGWLPIDDNTPTYEPILVTDGLAVYEAKWDGEEASDPVYNEWHESDRADKITHWQPLPLPPREFI